MYQERETLGQCLKRERESHRVPVEEIALFVGVDRSFIDALEGDDFGAPRAWGMRAAGQADHCLSEAQPDGGAQALRWAVENSPAGRNDIRN